MNDLIRNKHFPKKIASNLKFLNNLRPEWSRHVTIVYQTKDLHTADYTQLYDFLKYNQNENPRVQNDGIQNQIGNGNLVAVRAEGNAAGHNGNQIRCYNCRGRISSNPRNRQIAQPDMNMGQDRQMQMIGGNGGNQFRQYAGQNAGNLNGYNEVQNVGNQVAQNPRVQNVGTQNGLIGVQGNGI
nr:Gag-Pol polyprotein [Tanacetum cinerariifolium]